MDIGLKLGFDTFADPSVDMILAGSTTSHQVSSSIFAARPGIEVISATLQEVVDTGTVTNYPWGGWDMDTNLWQSLNATFDGSFDPSNVAETKDCRRRRAFKVQMLQTTSDFHTTNSSGGLIADNHDGCEPGIQDMSTVNNAHSNGYEDISSESPAP